MRGTLKRVGGTLKVAPAGPVSMREIRARFADPDGTLHDWGGAYGMGEVCPLDVYRVEVLADRTVTAVVRFEGDPDAVRERLEADETVVDASVTDRPDGLFYVRFEPRTAVRRMIDARRETPLAMRMPMQLDADGSATATFYGDPEDFTDALAMLPDDVAVDVEYIRDARPVEQSVFAALTARQREVLDVAVEAGYYDDPRGATHADLADALDVSPTTVSEHLRRIERRVFAAYRTGP